MDHLATCDVYENETKLNWRDIKSINIYRLKNIGQIFQNNMVIRESVLEKKKNG